jgi:hypothetical protein
MRTAAAATALGLVLVTAGLTSCATPKTGLQPPEPDPSATPVYGSEEEALAAAEELYGRYLRIANKIGQGGWKDTSGLEDVEKERALVDDQGNADELSAKGWIQVGESTFDSTRLQQLKDGGAGKVDMVVYLCVDVTSVDVLDRNGKSVIKPTRLDRQPLEIEMDDFDGQLKVNRSQAWSGKDFC